MEVQLIVFMILFFGQITSFIQNKESYVNNQFGKNNSSCTKQEPCRTIKEGIAKTLSKGSIFIAETELNYNCGIIFRPKVQIKLKKKKIEEEHGLLVNKSLFFIAIPSNSNSSFITIDCKSKARAFLIFATEFIFFSNFLFENGNSSPTFGGALLISDVENFTITNCYFKNNNSTQGGAIYTLNSFGTILNSIFLNNFGVIGSSINGINQYNTNPNSVYKILNNTFSDSDREALIINLLCQTNNSFNQSYIVEENTFINCNAPQSIQIEYGTAKYHQHNIIVEKNLFQNLSNTFESNVVISTGINSTKNTIIFQENTFQNNSLKDILFINEFGNFSALLVKKNNFFESKISVPVYGIVVELQGSNISSTFVQNNFCIGTIAGYLQFKNGLNLFGTSIIIEDNLFFGNDSVTTPTGISFELSKELDSMNINLIGNNFITTALGLWLRAEVTNNSAIQIQDNNFHNLKFEAVLMRTYANISIINNTFIEGSSTAVSISCYKSISKSYNFLIGNMYLRNNASFLNGGAVAIFSCLDYPIDIFKFTYPNWTYSSCFIFENNIYDSNSASSGSAVTIGNGEHIFINETFINNSAKFLGGAIFINSDSTKVDIFNSSFINNSVMGSGSAIQSSSSGYLSFQNTEIIVPNFQTNADTVISVNQGGKIDIGSNFLVNCSAGYNYDQVNLRYILHAKKRTSLDIKCIPCSPGSYSIISGNNNGQNLTHICNFCPFGANCINGSSLIQSTNGFWCQKNENLIETFLCPENYCCNNKSGSCFPCNSCIGNRTGILCGNCKQDFTEAFGTTLCRLKSDCNSNYKDFLFWPLVVLISFLFALYFIENPPLVTLLLNLTLWKKLDYKKSKLNSNDLNSNSNFQKIFFYFYQIVPIILITYESDENSILEQFIQLFTSVINFQINFSNNDKNPGICPYFLNFMNSQIKYLFQSSLPILIFLFIGIMFLFYKLLNKKKIEKNDDKFQNAFFSLILFSFSNFVNTTTILLTCININNESRMFLNGNILCYSNLQYFFLIFGIIYILPFPFILGIGSVFISKKKLDSKQFLLSTIFPLPFLIYWIFFKFKNDIKSYITVSEVNEDENNIFDQKDYISAKIEQTLILPFNVKYWDAVMSSRRLILISISTFIPNPFARLLIVTLLCLVFLQHHVYSNPFKDKNSNLIESFSLFSLIVLGSINLKNATLISNGYISNGVQNSLISNILNWIQLFIIGLIPFLGLILITLSCISLILRTVFIFGKTIVSLISKITKFLKKLKSKTSKIETVIPSENDYLIIN